MYSRKSYKDLCCDLHPIPAQYVKARIAKLY